MKKAFGRLVAGFSKGVTVASANQICWIFMHQPELPKSVKKLRKF